MNILIEHKDEIDWFMLSSNPSTIDYIMKHEDKIDWKGAFLKIQKRLIYIY
jgi:hypothetical protein